MNYLLSQCLALIKHLKIFFCFFDPLRLNILDFNSMKLSIHVMAIVFLLGLATDLSAQNEADSFALIPVPVSVQPGNGNFSITSATVINIPAKQEEVKKVAGYLLEKIQPSTGYNLQIVESSDSDAGIQFVLNEKAAAELGNEGYQLKASPDKIVISANEAAGLFYGVQTLLQLLPKEIESEKLASGVDWQIPSVSITDYPRFGWRGMMLDVSRHFFPLEYVKKYIDQMARYKYNRFHWHLTDDNGWRIQIKSLPKLTQVGAWRVPRHGTWNTLEPPKPGEAATDGGFYTQEEIKEIIQYAKDRYVEVIPEIDVPGHSMAAIAAYPELSCTQDSSTRVNPGSKFVTWHGGGEFTMHIENTLDPSNEKVYEFLNKVFTEVAALFPFEYIHMGGDECYKGYWEEDPDCQALMKEMGMKNTDELQSYFNTRVSKIIQDKGKKMIGWDEILEGGLPPGATVMSWRGMKGGIEAAYQNAKAIMSPSPMAYLDLYQGDPAVEPPTYSMARLQDSYNWDPVPEGVDPSYILGGQGNLWTEQISTAAQAEYMAYPRAFALAETYWSPEQEKNWPSFVNRVEDHFKRFDQAQLNYSRSMYDPIIKVKRNEENQMVLELATEVEGLDIYYTLNSAIPNQHYSEYKAPIVLTEGTDQFRVITYRAGKPIGKMISISMEVLEKRIGK